jgi:hypothetical protein
LQFERIRTIDAMERAAVGEFRDEGQRIGNFIGHANFDGASAGKAGALLSHPKKPEDAGKTPALHLEVESAFLLQKSEIAENVLFHFLRLRL